MDIWEIFYSATRKELSNFYRNCFFRSNYDSFAVDLYRRTLCCFACFTIELEGGSFYFNHNKYFESDTLSYFKDFQDRFHSWCVKWNSKKIFESVLHKSYKEYFEHLTSEYLSRLTNDISQFESNFFPVLLENISAILVYIFSFGIIFINNRKIALGLFSASMLF